MRVALLGVGQAGGKLVQAVRDFDRESGFGSVRGTLAVNTAEPDLQALDLETLLVGQDRVGGHGVGGDNELGATVMDENSTEVIEALDGTVTADVEAIFVVAGLGGGTGSGGAPVVIRELSRVFDRPVFAVGILPGRDEGALYHANAGRSLKTVVREADATLLVDNDAFRSAGESVSEGYATINAAIARRLGLLLAAGEATEGVGQSVVDSSEVFNTLRAGGVAALGYASAEASEDAAENVTVVTSLARRALGEEMSLPGARTASAGLFVVAGEVDRTPRKGVERARRWLEEETGSQQIRGGDMPVDSDRLAGIVLLAGVERSGVLDEFVERARVASESVDRPDPEAALRTEGLEDLF